MIETVREKAAKSIAASLRVLERAYRHGEQVVKAVTAHLRNELGLKDGSSINEYKIDEAKLLLRRFEGLFLCENREVWKSIDAKAEQLKKPILFICTVAKPKAPESVGGMCVLGGVIHGFQYKASPVSRKPDQHLSVLVGEFLDGKDLKITEQPEPVELGSDNKHAGAKARYLAARLVDLPEERQAMEFADRLIRLWKSK